mmetsp:Transcript_31471/g.70064  ORF Transcript_31471/g.70064 Transcript_31471/m.70064 type:complete len:152 (+) Transcript_31471:192-647(+)
MYKRQTLSDGLSAQLLRKVRAVHPGGTGTTAAGVQCSFMHLMGHVLELVATELLCCTLLQLPFSWVRLWAAPNEGGGDHEDSMALLLLLLPSWLAGPVGWKCSAQRREELRGQLLVWQLSSSHHSSIVPRVLAEGRLAGQLAYFLVLRGLC